MGSGADGLRERKKQETLHRIIDASLILFAKNGYAETTMEEIATAAGFSRRTIFHYFKNKHEIVLSIADDFDLTLENYVRSGSRSKRPFELLGDAIVEVLKQRDSEVMRSTSRMIMNDASLTAHRMARYFDLELRITGALRDVWPEEQAHLLRLVAMAAIGALRVGFENWLEGDIDRPLWDHARETFAILRRVVPAG